ncbi:MAG TPA: hypothetical protein VKU79_02525 [Thermoplasmataceae archaeon]|nr:hypothetical protein [Thermoplasmatales archaeon AK]HLH85721.1 hypothetical protein [Thermoplasmataceae archaeon]
MENEILYFSVIAVSVASLSIGAYTDIRSREVYSLLFLPLFALGIAYNIFLGFSILYVLLETAIFASLFLRSDTIIYISAGYLFIILSVVFAIRVNPYLGLQAFVSALMYLLGYRERLFGIGDLKAVVATLFATPAVNALIPFGLTITYLPVSIQYLFAISISSIFFIGLAALVLRKRSAEFGLRGVFVVDVNEEFAKTMKNKYAQVERAGRKLLSYRIPFMIPILAGYVLLVMGIV